MSRNGPGMSRKVLEASRRLWKVPVSTTHSPAPLALGGKPSRLPWPAKEVGAHQGEGILLQVGITKPKYGRFLGGRGGKVWKAWESKLDSQSSLSCALGPPGHLYNEGEGVGEQTHQTQRPMRHPSPSKTRCSTIRPRFRRCSKLESVRVFSL